MFYKFLVQVILFLFVVFCSNQVIGQDQEKIDSLFAVIEDLPSSDSYLKDTAIIDIYLELGEQFSKDNGMLDSAVHYFDNAIGMSEEAVKKWKTKLNEEKELYLKVFKAEGYSSKGKMFYRQKMFEISDSLGFQAIDILKPIEFKKNKSVRKKALKLYSSTLLWFGFSHHVRGKYDEALLHYAEADRVSKMTNEYKMQSMAVGTSAIIYKNQGRFKEALDYNFRALGPAKME